MAEAMVVRKERQMAPKTPTWTVEDPDGFDYTVFRSSKDGVVYCLAHGAECAHVDAVKAKTT